MRLLTLFFIICILLGSCNKEFYCKQKKITGHYNNLELESDILIRREDNGNLYTNLPKIDGPGFSNFRTRVELAQNVCSFELKGFYDNFAFTHSGPHYWLLGEGNGHFEKNKLFLDYRYTVTETSQWYADRILIDTSFSYTYIKM